MFKVPDNVVADALSRRVDLAALHVSPRPVPLAYDPGLKSRGRRRPLKLTSSGLRVTLVLKDGCLDTVNVTDCLLPHPFEALVIHPTSECHRSYAGHLGTEESHRVAL